MKVRREEKEGWGSGFGSFLTQPDGGALDRDVGRFTSSTHTHTRTEIAAASFTSICPRLPNNRFKHAVPSADYDFHFATRRTVKPGGGRRSMARVKPIAMRGLSFKRPASIAPFPPSSSAGTISQWLIVGLSYGMSSPCDPALRHANYLIGAVVLLMWSRLGVCSSSGLAVGCIRPATGHRPIPPRMPVHTAKILKPPSDGSGWTRGPQAWHAWSNPSRQLTTGA